MSKQPTVLPTRARRVPAWHARIAPSRRLAAVLVFVHVVAVAALCVASVAVWFKLIGLSLLVLNVVRDVRRHALLIDPRAVVELRLRKEGSCEVRCRDGRVLTCEIDEESYVVPWLVVLRLRPPGRKRCIGVVLVRDSLDQDAMRRLRVRLRWVDGVHAARSMDIVSL